MNKVRVIYDGRPIGPYKELEGEVIKRTPSGLLRIKAKFTRADGSEGEYNELFDPRTGYAKGWNTLRFERLS